MLNDMKECSSRKTVSFEEQIMSEEKIWVYKCQMKAILFTILQLFFVTLSVLKIEKYY